MKTIMRASLYIKFADGTHFYLPIMLHLLDEFSHIIKVTFFPDSSFNEILILYASIKECLLLACFLVRNVHCVMLSELSVTLTKSDANTVR